MRKYLPSVLISVFVGFLVLLSVGVSVSDEARKPGWKTPITSKNTKIPSGKLRLPNAPDSMEGLTFEQIITNPNVKIRPDGMSCSECHDWTETISKASFCGKIEKFLTCDQEGAGPKPKVLRDIFSDWKRRGCPD